MTGRRIAMFALLSALLCCGCSFMKPEISPEEELMRNLERIVREAPEKGAGKTKKATVIRFRPGDGGAMPEGTGEIRRGKN